MDKSNRYCFTIRLPNNLGMSIHKIFLGGMRDMVLAPCNKSGSGEKHFGAKMGSRNKAHQNTKQLTPQNIGFIIYLALQSK